MSTEPMNLPRNAHVRTVVPVAYGLCPDGDLAPLMDDLRDDLVTCSRDAAERRATDADRHLIDDGRFMGECDPPAGFADTDGLTWLAWEFDTAPNDGERA